MVESFSRKGSMVCSQGFTKQVGEFLKPVAVTSKSDVSFSWCVGLPIQRQTRTGWLLIAGGRRVRP